MSIHPEHPFATPEGLRDPLRRLRGRLAQSVSIWTMGELGQGPQGWTISSMLIAEGDPPEVIALLDPDSDLADDIVEAEQVRLTVNLLAAGQDDVADVFARLAPSPGGPFRTGEWAASDHGPRLVGAAGWLGVRLQAEPAHAGWVDAAAGDRRVRRSGDDRAPVPSARSVPELGFALLFEGLLLGRMVSR